MAFSHRLTGIVTAELLEVRFSYSGRVVKVYKQPGDLVTVGAILASLDRKELQAGLDQELADYERVRAEFEIFNLQNPNPVTDIIKYEKAQKQSALNSSVKSVEIAKSRLDQADLFSPVSGTVTSVGGLRANLFVTPGSYPVIILDSATFIFTLEVSWTDLKKFPLASQHKIKLATFSDPLTGTVLPFIPGSKLPVIRFSLPPAASLIPNLPGTLV